MPTTTRIGAESPANKAIGGVPAVHYLDFASKGRGQVLRLFFEDAGIAYDDVRYKVGDEFQAFKESELSDLNPLKTVPVVELNGQILTQSYPILRHFSRLLNSYDGTTEEDKFFVDRICDAAADWRTCFVNAYLGPNPDKDYPEHCSGKRVDFLDGLDKMLRSTGAPSGLVLDRGGITYADFVLYQILHDEGLTKEDRKGLRGQHERLAQLVDAVEARPAVAAFLASDRYLG